MARIDTSYEAGLVNFQTEVDDTLENYAQEVASFLFRTVVANTPVDTGALRASWEISGGKTPGREVNPKGNLAPGQASARALRKLKAKRFVDSDSDVITITNAKEYAVFIEQGHGKNNAPGAMVAASIQATKSRFNLS